MVDGVICIARIVWCVLNRFRTKGVNPFRFQFRFRLAISTYLPSPSPSLSPSPNPVSPQPQSQPQPRAPAEPRSVKPTRQDETRRVEPRRDKLSRQHECVRYLKTRPRSGRCLPAYPCHPLASPPPYHVVLTWRALDDNF